MPAYDDEFSAPAGALRVDVTRLHLTGSFRLSTEGSDDSRLLCNVVEASGSFERFRLGYRSSSASSPSAVILIE